MAQLPCSDSTRARAILLLLLPVLLPLLTACGSDSRRPRSPNFLLILADDFGTHHFGSAARATPTLDELAARGVCFDNGFVSTARCGPVRSAVCGGLFPRESEMTFNRTDLPFEFDHDNWLAAILHRAGYRTFMGGTFPGDAREAGYDTIDAGADFGRNDQASLLDFLAQDDEPFFVWYGPRLPHVPHEPPLEYLDRIDPAAIEIPAYIHASMHDEYRRRERELYAMEAWFDDRLHQVLDHLRELGKLRDTIVIFINDNGVQNGLVAKGSPYEAGIRTPFIFYSQRWLPRHETRPEWVLDVDIFATVLDYAGVDAPRPHSGRSIRTLMGTLPGDEPGWPEERVGVAYPKNAVHGVWWRDAYAIHLRHGRYKLIRWLRDVRESDNEILGIHHEMTDFPARNRGDEELYDLDEDPFELVNRIDDPGLADQRQELSRALRDWLEAHVPRTETDQGN